MSDTQKQPEKQPRPLTDKENASAIPYVPPPPPEGKYQVFSRSPMVNTLAIVAAILLVGFMAYNFVGQRLTITANESMYRESVTATPSLTPPQTDTSTPSY